MDETPVSEGLDPETLTDGDADSTAGWMSLREVEALTGVKVRTLRAWYGSGKIDSRMAAGPHGRQRLVRVDQVEQVRGAVHPAGPTTTEAVLSGRMATGAGAGLIPIEVFEKVEAAWQEVVLQRSRAEVAELKLQFETERRQREQERREAAEARVAELEAIVTPQPKPDLPDIPDDVVARLAAEVEELRAHRPPAPWWKRVQIQIPRRGPRGSKD